MSKTLRTPIIMPRKQGGTFYTFGSAMEDIGLNINESHNRVEISHYVLLNLPKFTGQGSSTQDTYLDLKTTLNYDDDIYTKDSSTQGDFIFAESFQDYCLNMETVIRNLDNYNYASNKTVSERVFWKWMFRHLKNNVSLVEDGKYFYEDPKTAIAKGFGAISAGSQRTDDSGLYNETFVQIPSSYGQMRVLFKKVVDENYMADKDYTGTNKDLRGYIENISEEDIEYPDVIMFKMSNPEMSYPAIGTHITEVSTGSEFIVKDTDGIDAFIYCTWVSDIVDLPDSGNLSINGSNYGYDWYRDNSGGRKNKDIVIAATGISPKASADSFNSYGDPVYNVSENTDMFEVEFDITKLNEYYKSKGGNDNLTYDNIGMGNVGITEIEDQYGDYTFNAILVYYSIYDSNKTKRLATNAYGIYLLDNSLDANVDNYFYYPSIDKFKSTNKKNGSSYSFRINVKPTTAYSGDIRVNDNSTAAYSMSEDFNDVLRNLTAAVTTLKENAKTLYDVVKANNAIKQLAQDTMEKVNDIETNVDNIKNGNFPYTASEIYTEEKTGTNITPSVAKNVLNGFVIGMDSNGNIKMSIDINSISDSTAKAIANSIQKTINNKNYIDVMSVVALLIARSNGTTLLTTTKQISSQHASINQDAVVNLHHMSIDPINPRYAYSE